MATQSIVCVFGVPNAGQEIEVPRGESLTISIDIEVPSEVAGEPNVPYDCSGGFVSISWECARGSTGAPRTLRVDGNANGRHTLLIPAAEAWYFADAPYQWDAWFTRSDGVSIQLQRKGILRGVTTVGPVGLSVAQETPHRVYSGVGVASITAPATIEAMAHQDITSRSFLAPVTASNQKIYIAHPASWGTPSLSIGGFALDTLTPTAVALHDATGELIVYTLYESRYLLTITATVDVRF